MLPQEHATLHTKEKNQTIAQDRTVEGYKNLKLIQPKEFYLVEKIHQNLCKKSFNLTKRRHKEFHELLGTNKVTQRATNTSVKLQNAKELQSDTSVVILPADKSRSTVILNREDYLEKRMNHINNGPYELLKKDPATKIKGKTLRQLMALKDNSCLRSYGQPKIHKPEVRLRLFVSYSGFKLYNLNKYIADF